MSVASQRAAIVAMVAAVPYNGPVHDEEPFVRTEADLRELYTWQDGMGGTQLRGWYLRRVRTTERLGGIGRTVNSHNWELRGFMAMDPANGSGKAFDDLIEAIRRAYRQDETIGGAVQPGPLDQLSGWQVNNSLPVLFCGALCHSATLALTTYEYLDAGE